MFVSLCHTRILLTILLAINGVPDDDVASSLLALDTGLGFIELGASWSVMRANYL